MKNQTLELYQFPISHYCEKIRWALDYKGLDYNKINWLPGLHLRSAKKIAPTSNVPILKQGGTIIQGSAQIIDYLDATFPEHALGFEDPHLNAQAKEWERFADEHIGPHTRRIIYHDLLNYPDLVIPLFAHEGPWYSNFYFKLAYPKLTQIMRKVMKINANDVAASKEALQNALTKLNDMLNSKQGLAGEPVYLVGNRFSRADLSISALLAPLFLADKYGLNWPNTWPPELQTLLESYQTQIAPAKRWYQDHR
jgi:glutathione S-transferase